MNLWKKASDLCNLNVVTCFALMSVTLTLHLYYFVYSYLAWAIVLLSLFINLLVYKDSIKFDFPKKLLWLTGCIALLGVQILFSQLINNGNMILGIVYSSKFFIFSLILSMLYVSRVTFRDVEKCLYMYMAIFLIYYSVGLIFPELNIFWRDGSGRAHTYLVFPGELCYVGIFFTLFTLSKLLFKINIKDFLGFCLGIFLIGLDGSRSSLLCFLVVSFVAILIRNQKVYKKFLYAFSVLIIVYTLIVIFSRNYAGGPNVAGRFEGGVETFAKVVDHSTPNSMTATKVATASRSEKNNLSNDSVRTKMIIASKNVILNASLIGNGINATSVQSGNKNFVLHVAYVQVLGDYGYLGLFIFLLIIAIQFSMIPFKSFNKTPQYLFMLLVIIVQPMMFFFHPISNEISNHMFLFLVLILTYKEFLNNSKEALPII